MHYFFLFFLCASLAGCIPAAFVGGSTLLISSLAEERSTGKIFDDAAIRAKIDSLLLDTDPKFLFDLEITVREGCVLLTGSVETEEQHSEMIRLTWQVEGVQEVFDHIIVGEGGGMTGYARDSLITTELRADFTFCNELESVNYTIKTVEGVVYLMGIAQSQKELETAIELARKIEGVQKVISYVRIKDNTRSTERHSPPEPLPEPSPQKASPSQKDFSTVQVQSLDQPNTLSSFS